jgi:hypothetical protein
MKFSFSKIGAYLSIVKHLPKIVEELQGLVKGLKDGVGAEDLSYIESTITDLESLVAEIAAAVK